MATVRLGMLLVIGGTLAFLASIATSIISIGAIGWLLIVAGSVELVAAFRIREAPFVPDVLVGVASIVIGALVVDRPSVAAIASYLVAAGLFRGITAAADRYRSWGWDLAYGIIAVLLGRSIAGASWLAGTVVAIEIITRGFTLMAASLAAQED